MTRATGTDELEAALGRNGVVLATVFGSSLRGGEARDVDVAVLFRSYGFEHYLATLERVQEALGSARVDLVVLNLAPPPVRLRALLEGRLVFTESPGAFAGAVAEALRDYSDYRRFLGEYRESFNRRCREGLSVAERRMDRERVEASLAALDEAVGHLRRLAGRVPSFEAFKDDVDTRELCVHFLRIALESVLDICRHFLAVVGVRLVEVETKNLVELAEEKGLLDPAFARKVRGMAGMRNAIVHVYTRLDYEAVYRAVTSGLADLDEFARQVRDRLNVTW